MTPRACSLPAASVTPSRRTPSILAMSSWVMATTCATAHWGVCTITRKDSKLFLESIGQPVLEPEQTDEAEFTLTKFDLMLRFEQIDEGAATRLVIWQHGTALRLERINGETAKVIKQAIADRIRDHVPMPG